jgi:hypothetical protein
MKTKHKTHKYINMKKIITCLFTLLVMGTAYGQGNFEEGTSVIGVGIGLGDSYGSLGYGSSASPAINLQYEHGIWPVAGPGVISLGGYFAYKSYSYDYDIYSWSSHYMIIGVRSAYHFNMIESAQWDVYAGLMLGYRSISYSDDVYLGSNGTQSDIVFAGFLGARYYFSENWAGFAELGNGISVLNLGVAYKF